ncbi:hypothetical protein [Magnetovibrio sp.]|uniref:hypothetical protein n=1 Tax=Magnetovibrio sp. TaxID=2024836 RepID=UPI002F955E3C
MDHFLPVKVALDIALSVNDASYYSGNGKYLGNSIIEYFIMKVFDDKGTLVLESSDTREKEIHLMSVDAKNNRNYAGSVMLKDGGMEFYGDQGNYLGNLTVKKFIGRHYFGPSGENIGTSNVKVDGMHFYSADGQYQGNAVIKGTFY